jgi:hypothetical protein
LGLGARLPDDTAFLVGSPGERFRRIPLAIALSRDGLSFDRAFAIRTEPTTRRHEGLHKDPGYRYPGALVWQDRPYVIHSINQEDVAVSRIALAGMVG